LPGESNVVQSYYAPIAQQDTLKKTQGNLNKDGTKIAEIQIREASGFENNTQYGSDCILLWGEFII
jgi:hypothetical protein